MVFSDWATIAALVTAFLSLVTCVLAYKNSRPKIKIKVNKVILVEHDQTRFVLVDLDITNNSMVQGCISNICLRCKKYKCDAEKTAHVYEFGKLKIDTYDNKIPTHLERLKTPICVGGYSFVNSYIVFPNVADNVAVGSKVGFGFCYNNNVLTRARLFVKRFKVERASYAFYYQTQGIRNNDNQTSD